jgi:ribose transport system permease protein
MSEHLEHAPTATAQRDASRSADAQPPPSRPTRAQRLLRYLSPRNASALYVFAAIFILFSLWIPETFLTIETWRVLLSDQAIIALAAIALVVPLSAGMFDLSVGASVGFGAVLVSWLLARKGLAIGPAIVLTLAAGAVIGLVNSFLVVQARVDALIATLGMSSILAAFTAWVSNNSQVVGVSASFQSIGSTKLFGIALPVFIMLAVALVVWYLLERTATGRRVYATGGNAEAARLAGVRVSRVIVASFVACGTIAVLAGILESSQLGTGDPTIGPTYLLPAFSAAFLGSTQFKAGRFNVWGTVVAVYAIATGIKGLQLAGAPIWIPQLFNGVALVLAVALARYERSERTASIRRMFRGASGLVGKARSQRQPATPSKP